MRLTTWNVNGIRNPFAYQPWNSARTFPAMFDILGSDIVVMQELKIQRKDLRDDMVLIDGWDCFFSLPKHKKGYSGVGIFTRNATCAPLKAEEGLLGVLPSPSGTPYCDLPIETAIGGYPDLAQIADIGVDPIALDAEGRCVILEFPAFVLLGVYSPANSNGLRDDFRHGFTKALDCRIRNLTRLGKRVVLVGDLNVSRDERDTASAFEDCRKEGITHEEYISTPNRRIFNQLLVGGEVVGGRDGGRAAGVLWDTTRGFHPERRGMYTHWEQKINARPGNYGSRIDFVLVAESMRTWIKDANIQEGLLGSDHCPVFVDFHEQIQIGDDSKAMGEVMNPPALFEEGSRKRDWTMSDSPAFSAKRLPEFDKRRSIKSMFGASSVKKPASIPQQESAKPSENLHDFSREHSLVSQTSLPDTTTSRDFSDQQNKDEDTRPNLKRKSVSNSKASPIKRQKSDATIASRGQQSLRGFFQAQSVASKPNDPDLTPSKSEAQGSTQSDNIQGTPTTAIAPVTTPETVESNGHTATDAVQNPHASQMPPQPPSPGSSVASADFSPSKFSSQLAAAEQTQKTWGALFAKPIAPLCESHNEPCKSMQTKKKGSNQGRSFWMCARPLGPSGNKEKGTQWRCATFIWCSDWGGKREGAGD